MNIKNTGSIFIYTIYLILFFIPVLIYRIEIFSMILEIYPEFNTLKFADYLLISRKNDLKFILIAYIPVTILSFIPFFSIKIKIIFNSIILFISALIYLIFSEFFKIYQTSFQLDFVGKEHFTGIASMLSSAIAELSFILFIKISVYSIIISAISYFILKFSERNSGNNKIIIPISLFIIFFLIYIIPSGEILNINLPFSKDIHTKNRTISQLAEFSINPFNELFFSRKKPIETKLENSKNFSYKLNTDSLELKKRIPSLNLIPKNKKYNIILYFFESTAYSYLDLKIGGRYVTAEMQKLSKNSFFAENHYANFPLSANAMLSVLTSSYDSCAKDPVITDYPDIRLKAVSEILSSNGYRTALIHTGGLGYAGQDRFLKSRKFDRIIEYKDLIKIPPYNYEVGWGLDERSMIEPAYDFIKKSGDTPYFITMLPANPHHPYAIPDESFNITTGMKSSSWNNYLNSLHFADYALGELIRRLESENMLDNTLVFIFADHGEAFYQHKRNYNHPFYLYEENVHVPFMIYNKKLFKKRVNYDGITRHIDISPTILNLAGIKIPDEYEGVPVFNSKKEQLALLHTYWKDDIMAVRDGKWKYILNMTSRFEELYDISADPLEKNNIIENNKIIAKRYADFINSARKYKKEYYRKILSK